MKSLSIHSEAIYLSQFKLITICTSEILNTHI